MRGFAVKFYTEEGNWDIVGNDIPVFFIQDAVKFPDIIHAVKPEPHNEIPQGQSAHNNFWDFAGLQPESKSCNCTVLPLALAAITSCTYGHVGDVGQRWTFFSFMPIVHCVDLLTRHPSLVPNDTRFRSQYFHYGEF